MIWLICVLALFVILLLIPIRVSAEYVYSLEKKQNIFKVKIFGISVYESGKVKDNKNENSGSEPSEKSKFSFEEFKGIFKKWDTDEENIKKHIGNALKSLRRVAALKKAYFKTEFGLGDAALTGIFSGVAYGVVYNIFAVIYYYFNIKKKNLDIHVCPDFTKEKAEVSAKLIFGARLFFAGIAVFDIIKAYNKLKKKNA